ncbi:nuclear transport factor 2 family protein [Promicromonospora sp. MEB111]|uniref:nuclear transport factor 2 family protein n=1 Tax=Promicromonospora sp. MEB111 TaxID=3040301 RepID=UPI00254B33CE|nr:nuclear transport factor 2 family protein [Promicromonospora sp. MEB111]
MTARPATPASVELVADPPESAVRVAVIELFAARIAGASPRDLAQRFDADVDLTVRSGDGEPPWSSRGSGRARAAEHFARLRETVDLEQFDLVTIRASGRRAVVTGTVRVTVRATGLGAAGAFVLDIAVAPHGLITRYHLLEDGWAARGAG